MEEKDRIAKLSRKNYPARWGKDKRERESLRSLQNIKEKSARKKEERKKEEPKAPTPEAAPVQQAAPEEEKKGLFERRTGKTYKELLGFQAEGDPNVDVIEGLFGNRNVQSGDEENTVGGVTKITPADLTTLASFGKSKFAGEGVDIAKDVIQKGAESGAKTLAKKATDDMLIKVYGDDAVKAILKGITEAGGKLTNTIRKIGRPVNQDIMKKITFPRKNILRTFATNLKSQALTKGSLLRHGLRNATITFIAGAFGTYPFAAWAQQEILSSLKVNARDARLAGDFETAEAMITMREETEQNPWWRDLPYKNLVRQFEAFFEADRLARESERRLIAAARGEISFEGQDVGEDIAERDELNREYYALIRNGLYEEADQLFEG